MSIMESTNQNTEPSIVKFGLKAFLTMAPFVVAYSLVAVHFIN